MCHHFRSEHFLLCQYFSLCNFSCHFILISRWNILCCIKYSINCLVCCSIYCWYWRFLLLWHGLEFVCKWFWWWCCCLVSVEFASCCICRYDNYLFVSCDSWITTIRFLTTTLYHPIIPLPILNHNNLIRLINNPLNFLSYSLQIKLFFLLLFTQLFKFLYFIKIITCNWCCWMKMIKKFL